MNALTNNVQVIMEDGNPAFAVIPYGQFKLICQKIDELPNSDEVPHEVAAMVLEKGYSAPKAWRKYLRLNQSEAAAKIGVSQAALSQIESNDRNQPGTLQKIAAAYGLSVEQLDI